MSSYDFLQPRERHRSLFIVEGHHEKHELIELLLRCFPEINIKRENIVMFETNIYVLYDKICEMYGADWDEQDIDLVNIVGKCKGESEGFERKNFSDIFLIFDYEHQDPNFSEEKICRLQKYFNDSVEVGRLYINYPMVESYMHFPGWPDGTFENAEVQATLKRGKEYKTSIKNYLVAKMVNLPTKIDEILKERFSLVDAVKRELCKEQLLLLNDSEGLQVKIGKILSGNLDGRNLQTATRQLLDVIERASYCNMGLNYYTCMRALFKTIVWHNICKANLIQGHGYNIAREEMKEKLFSLDFLHILEAENEFSRDPVDGVIKVLNTSVFFVQEYRFALLMED